MEREKCKWIYRPGSNNSHWAYPTCEGVFNYLSKLSNSEPYVGVADYYNGKQCPICEKCIEMDYGLINNLKKIKLNG